MNHARIKLGSIFTPFAYGVILTLIITVSFQFNKSVSAATIVGTKGDDFLIGDSEPNTIKALAGNDQIHGGPSKDNIYGDKGDDYVVANEGNDVITGGIG